MQPANKRPSKCCVYIRDIKWCLALPPKEWAGLSSKTKPYWENKRFLHWEEEGRLMIRSYQGAVGWGFTNAFSSNLNNLNLKNFPNHGG